jgi:hypothetical protein
MGNFTGAELNRVGKPRGLTGLACFPFGFGHPIDKDPRYICNKSMKLEQVLSPKSGPFVTTLSWFQRASWS